METETGRELRRAIKISQAGDRELGETLLLDLLERTSGEVNWGRHELTGFCAAIFSRPELEAESEQIFRSLVPERLDRADFERHLNYAVELLFQDAMPDRVRFHHCGREFSQAALLDDLWLQSGYLRWVNLYRCGLCWVEVVCGGVVETFREVLHHDEGTAPFHLLLKFESLQELDVVRVGPDNRLGTVVCVFNEPEEAYEVEFVGDELSLVPVRPWELKKAEFH